MLVRRSISLANGTAIGEGCAPFFAAEIGINHNGDLELAREMIRAAARAGATAVKFQNYLTEDFIADRSLTHTYLSGGKEVVESQYEMFKRCELGAKDLRLLRSEADQCGVLFFTTPTGETTLNDAVEAGVSLLKNGSDYLGHLPLIRAMARTGIPTVLSTGMALLTDIEDAVTAFEGAGGTQLILLHCVSSYPTPPADVNLHKIAALRDAFGVPVGFSDHTEGSAAAIVAVALGACFIEKHFTIDRNLPGPDHWFSADESAFAELTKGCRTAYATLGSSVLRPTAEEALNRMQWRLSCTAADDLRAGEILSSSHIAFARPGSGYPPKAVDEILGRVLTTDLPKGATFTRRDFVGG